MDPSHLESERSAHSGITAAPEARSGPSPNAPVVPIYDPRQERCNRVCDLVRGLNLQPSVSSQGLEGMDAAAPVWLVALSEMEAQDGRIAHRLGFGRQEKVRTICYGDRIGEWSLGLHARLLLAGAGVVLDSSDEHFLERLRRRLTSDLRAEASDRNEQAAIDQTMRETGLVGASDGLRRLVGRTRKISALSDLAVLITGETGTGKEVFARALWKLDPRRKGQPFVAVNCAALVPTLMEAELFGHESGVFTGADRRRRGLFRAADRGVLFLDEIAELDLGMQAKLLRALQDHCVRSVGQESEDRVDVRVIAATNRDLAECVRLGRFREDLFHRLHVITLRIPPLRERPADIAPLVSHFMAESLSDGTLSSLRVDPLFLAALGRMPLPGNVRELQNLIRNVVMNKLDEEPISLADLPAEAWMQLATTAGPPELVNPSDFPPTPGVDLDAALVSLLESSQWKLARAVQVCEITCIRAALERSKGNQTQAARLLGITARSVYNKLRRRSMSPPRSDRSAT